MACLLSSRSEHSILAHLRDGKYLILLRDEGPHHGGCRSLHLYLQTTPPTMYPAPWWSEHFSQAKEDMPFSNILLFGRVYFNRLPQILWCLKRTSRQKDTTEPFYSSNKTTTTNSSCRVDNVSHVETKPAMGQTRRIEKWPENIGEEEASRKHEVWWGKWEFAQRKHFKGFLRTVHLRNSEIFFLT